MTPLITFLIAAAVLATLYSYVVYPAFVSPLAKIPAANFSARFSSLWLKYIRYRNIENRTVYALHQKHGPIVRLGPKELSINCYEGGLKTVYGGSFPKTNFYERQFQFYNTPTMFTTIDAHAHSIRKRMLSHTYSKSSLLASPALRATTTAILHTRLLPLLSALAANGGTPTDVLPLSYAYSMDSFTAFQFGLPRASRFLTDAGERDWYLRRFLGVRPYAFWATEAPTLGRWLRVVPAGVRAGWEELEAWNLRKCDDAEAAVVSSEAQNDGDADDDDDPGSFPTTYATLSAKLHHDESEKARGSLPHPHPHPRRLELAADMFDHSAAAMETSGLTLTWLLYELSCRPHLQARLRAELLTLSSSSSPPPTPTINDPKALDALPLLDAILLETLRLWPAVPGRQPRMTPATVALAGCAVGVPGGVTVQAYAHGVHREADVFPAPEEWRPERWMEGRVTAEMRRWFWAFGSGGRVCVGRWFAMNSMKQFVAAVYAGFETEVVDAEGIEQGDGFMAAPKGGKLVLRFRRVGE